MADQVTVDNGDGTDYTVSTDDAGASGHVQRVKLTASADGSAAHIPADATDGLLVNLGANNDVTVASLPLPTGAGSAANQTTIIGHVDGIETAVASTNTKLDTVNTNLGTIDGRVDGIEALLTTIDADTSALAGAVSGSEMQVDVVTSALPTGAATAAKQPALGTAGTSSADVLSVQGRAGMTAVVVDGSAVTQPVSAASLPLPTGAATAAKQPALGTAGSASADVITVQGRAAMTPLLTDGSATTQPVSHAALTELAAAINASAVDVNIVGGSSSGTEYTEGDTDASIAGQAFMWEDTSDTLRAVSAAKPLPVNIISGAGSGGTAIQDDTAFTPGTSNVTPIGGTFDDTGTDSVDEGDAGAVRMSGNRNLYVRIRDNAGNERGLNIDANGALAATVTNATAANLNVTEASAAAIAASASVLDDWDESDRAKVNVIAGQAGVAAGAGAVGATVQRVTLASDDPAVVALQALDNAVAGNEFQVDVVTLPALAAGTNNIGDVDVLTLPALPAGNNNIGDVDIASIAAGDNNIGNVDIVTMPNVTLAAGTNTNEVVGDVAQDAAVAGNPLLMGGRASTATPSAMSADGDAVFAWHDRAGAHVITGYVAQDAAVAGNPVLNGARASTAVPTAMSADGDSVHLWADLNGSLVVRPRVKQLDIAVTPTIDTAVYALGDRLGSVMTFANAALVSGGTGTVTKAVLHDEAASNIEIWLHLFKVSPTLANADNGVLDITDANLATAVYVATIKFLTTDTKSFGTSNRVCEGTWLGGPPAISYETSGSSSLFGVLEARGAYDAVATDDIIVTLSVLRD